jgi:hypothetical protein
MARAGMWRVGGEVILLLLVLGCLGAALGLVLAACRRPEAEPTRLIASAPIPSAQSEESAQPPPAPPPSPAPEPEDPTQPILAQIAEEVTAERDALERADREAASRAELRRRAEAERDRWARREMLVRAQAEALERRANRIEEELAGLAGRRDVLAQRRDALRRELEEARARASAPDSFAVTPYRGPSGTWRCPVVLDCDARGVTLRPDGPTIERDEIVLGFGRSSPLTAVVRQAAARVEGTVAEDGAPTVPYLLFLVRPDGIRAYYEARTVLETLGIAFGYELVGQDWTIDVPALDASGTAHGRLSLGAADPATRPFVGGLERRRASGIDPADGRLGPSTPGVGATRPPGIGSVAPLAREPGSRREASASLPRATLDAIPDGPPIPYVPDRRRGRGSLSDDHELDGFIEVIPGRARERDTDAAGRGVGAGATRRDPPGGSRRPGGGVSGAGGPGTLGRSAFADQGRPGDTPSPGMGRSAQGLPGHWGDAPLPSSAGAESEPDAARRGESGAAASLPGEGGLDARHNGGARVSGSAPSSFADSAERTGTTGGTLGPRGPAAQGTGEPPGFARGGSGSTSVDAPRAIPIPIPGLGSPGPGAGAGFGSPGSSAKPRHESADILELPGGLIDRAEPGDWFDLILTCGPSGVTVQPGGYRVSLGALESGDLLVRRLRAIVAGQERAGAEGTLRPRLRFVVEPGGARAYGLARRRTTFADLDWPASLRVNETAVPSPFATSGGPR